MYDILFIVLYAIVLASIVASMVVVLILVFRLSRKQKANLRLMEHAAEMNAAVQRAEQRSEATAERFEVQRSWYRELFNNFPEFFLVCGVDGDGLPGPFVEANRAACDYLGFSRQALLKKNLTDIQQIETGLDLGFTSGEKVEDRRQAVMNRVVKNMVERAIQVGSLSYEARFRKANGDMASVLVALHVQSLNGNPMLVLTARDLKEARREQTKRKESERRLRDFFRHSPFGIATYDGERRLVTVNQTCLSMFGMPDQREFEYFNLFESPFLPEDIRERLKRGENVVCEIAVNFDDARKHALFVSRREGRRHYKMFIGNMGHDEGFVPRGYFAQIEDVTDSRALESELRKFQAAASEPGGAAGISGSLQNVDFSDMIQILCAGSKRMAIDIQRGETKAQVLIRDGDIVHCAIDGVQGDEAFYQLMTWHDGDFTAKPCDTFEVQTITTSAMGLLMEGARRIDEG